MENVIEVLDSDDEEPLSNSDAVPRDSSAMVEMKPALMTPQSSDLSTNILSAGNVNTLVFEPKSVSPKRAVLYWDGAKFSAQSQTNKGENIANTISKNVVLQSAPVKTVHNTVIRKIITNQRKNIIVTRGQGEGTGEGTNPAICGTLNSSAHALLSGQNVSSSIRQNLPNASVDGSVQNLNAPIRGKLNLPTTQTVTSGQVPYVAFRGNLPSTLGQMLSDGSHGNLILRTPQGMDNAAPVRANVFVPATHGMNTGQLSNAALRHKSPQTVTHRRTVTVSSLSRKTVTSVRTPRTAGGTVAPTLPIYRHVTAPIIRNPKSSMPTTPAGIASSKQLGTPGQKSGPVGTVMNLPDSAIKSKPFTVGNKTLSFNMAGNNFTFGGTKTSTQSTTSNNVFVFSGNKSQGAVTTTATTTSTTFSSTTATAHVRFRSGMSAQFLNTSIKTPPQQSLLKKPSASASVIQSDDLPSTSTAAVAAANVKVEMPPQQQHVRRPRKSALGPSLACDDFEVLTLPPEDSKIKKNVKKPSVPNARSLLKSNNLQQSHETYEYSQAELNSLNNLFRDFMLKPQLQQQMRAIAEERARINYMLSSFHLPQIKFKTFLTEDALRHDLQKSLKVRKIKLLSQTALQDADDCDDAGNSR